MQDAGFSEIAMQVPFRSQWELPKLDMRCRTIPHSHAFLGATYPLRLDLAWAHSGPILPRKTVA
jgi:hypothetical protein